MKAYSCISHIFILAFFSYSLLYINLSYFWSYIYSSKHLANLFKIITTLHMIIGASKISLHLYASQTITIRYTMSKCCSSSYITHQPFYSINLSHFLNLSFFLIIKDVIVQPESIRNLQVTQKMHEESPSYSEDAQG